MTDPTTTPASTEPLGIIPILTRVLDAMPKVELDEHGGLNASHEWHRATAEAAKATDPTEHQVRAAAISLARAKYAASHPEYRYRGEPDTTAGHRLTDPSLAAAAAPDEREALYVDIANRAQEITGRGIWPSTVKAVLEVAASVSAAAPDERARVTAWNGWIDDHRDHGSVTRELMAAFDAGWAAAVAARPAPVVNAADVDAREALRERITAVVDAVTRLGVAVDAVLAVLGFADEGGAA